MNTNYKGKEAINKLFATHTTDVTEQFHANGLALDANKYRFGNCSITIDSMISVLIYSDGTMEVCIAAYNAFINDVYVTLSNDGITINKPYESGNVYFVIKGAKNA